jgi:hypothetical protein
MLQEINNANLEKETNRSEVYREYMRKESRGTHIRENYEFMDNDNWILRIMSCKGEDGLMKLSTRSPKVTKMELPEGGIYHQLTLCLFC